MPSLEKSKIIPLFKSHYSFGRSILTLKEPVDNPDLEASDSVFQIVKDSGLKEVFLVEDDMSGFLEAHKRSKELGVKLIFGRRVTIDADEPITKFNPDHKLIIFARNDEGARLLMKIESKMFCENNGLLNQEFLLGENGLWSNDLMLAVPFYDSFLHVNAFTFSRCVFRLDSLNPVFFLEDHSKPIDQFLQDIVLTYCNDHGYESMRTHSIYYKEKKDVSALMAHKIICNKSFGKKKTLDCPNLDHFGSNTFCWESYNELG